jgi:hypothetical protein
VSLNYTPLRHKMLAAIATSEASEEVKKIHWSRGWGKEPDCYDRWGQRLTGAEQRCVRQIDNARLTRRLPGATASMYAARPLALARTGRDLLAEWTSQHGEPT